MLSLALRSLLPAVTLPLALSAQEIRVHDASSGCFHSSKRDDVWTAQGGAFVCGARKLTQASVDEIRRVVLASSEGALDPDVLLASVGVRAQSLVEHRDELVAASLPPAWKSRARAVVQDHIEPLLTWERLRDPIAHELLSANWGCTTTYELEIMLPGVPAITLRSEGLVPWMLPWKVTAGARAWTSQDVAISKAVRALVASDGPCAALLDGEEYWRRGFWSDERFWPRWVGADLDASLAEVDYAAIDGYALTNGILRVENARTGNIDRYPLAMVLTLVPRYPAAIDEIWWWNPIEDGRTTSTWRDVLGTWRAAMLAVAREDWIGAWKRAGAERTVGLEVVGARGIGETMLDTLVMPAWIDAGFVREPDYELLLRRKGRWCATIYLALGQPGALITTAHAGEGEHWLDALEFEFHPRATPPTYARVDAAGRVEIRTLR